MFIIGTFSRRIVATPAAPGDVASIGSVADAYDNALADIEYATAGWVSWYDDDRLHHSIGLVPPIESEAATLPANSSVDPYRDGTKPQAIHP
ncbi:hypothetical protein GCM10023147_12950 [Tsukamurella soli]|uniref:Integrase core domain-containing protein n=1 Tax=Tsukamurella soli TaxID=644556 RepID=A0ABP8JAR2_9ACTN